MKKRALKSFLCLSLSAALLFSEAGMVFADTTDVKAESEEIEATVQTEAAGTTDIAVGSTEVENAAETERVETAETESTETAEVENTETVKTDSEEAAEVQEAVEAAEVTATQTADDSVIDATGYNVVDASQAVLANVNGIAYDPETNILSWNAVAGANCYVVKIIDPDTQQSVGSYTVYGLARTLSNSYTEGKAYTVSITAKSSENIYIVGTPKSYYDATSGRWIDERYTNGDNEQAKLPVYETADDYYSTNDAQWITDASYTEGGYWSTITNYTYYNFPKSQETVTGVILNPAKAPVNTRVVTPLSGIALKEVTESRVYFTVSPMTLQETEYIRVEYSNNAAFDDSVKNGFVYTASKEYGSIHASAWGSDGTEGKTYYTYDNADATFSANLNYFLPGETVYVRARVYNAEFALAAGETNAAKFSNYVTFSYKVPAAVMGTVSTSVTSSSIRLTPSLASGTATGFQFQKYINKTWVNLSKQSGYSAYTDSNLSADTTYTYRVRAYSYSPLTKKTVYTGWQKVSAYTWGASLNVKAAAASSTSVKLTWSKVSKADGYEIYRSDTRSYGYNVSAGEDVDAFENMTLVKTIKKASTVSYTDKKLTSGEDYYYVVRAYRTVGKTKSYIEGSAYILLSSDSSMGVYANYYTSTGSKTVKWDKMTGIKGYKIEKYDPVTKTYKAYKTLKSTATSVTLPKVAAGLATADYRIYPYTSTKNLKGKAYYVTVEAKLAAVKNVKATATSEGIKVTWSAVSGADYYEVYRCNSDAYEYDKTTKTYSISEGTLVQSVTLDTTDVLNTTPYKTATDTDASGRPTVSYSYKGGTDACGWIGDAPALYNDHKTGKTSEITGTSVVDKTVNVQTLIPKSSAEISASNDVGAYSSYVKDVNGVLQTQTTALVEGPTAGNTYYYVVKAVAKPKNGAVGQNSYTYSMGYTKPAAAMYTAKSVKKATSVKVKSSKKGQATVSFKKATGASGYMIYRATKKNGKYTLVGSTTKTSYTDKTATAGKTYYYKVAAYTNSETGTYVYSAMTTAKSVKIKK